jgi:hypothetical protein
MTAASVWRARGYWTLAIVLLPIVNPPLLVTSLYFEDGNGSVPWIPVALCILLLNWMVLWLVAQRTWTQREARRWRVAAGVVAATALSFVFGALELYAFLALSCSHGGCWD